MPDQKFRIMGVNGQDEVQLAPEVAGGTPPKLKAAVGPYQVWHIAPNTNARVRGHDKDAQARNKSRWVIVRVTSSSGDLWGEVIEEQQPGKDW